MGMYAGAIGAIVLSKENLDALLEEAHHDSAIDRLVNCIHSYDGLLEINEEESGPQFVKNPLPNGDTEIFFIAGMRHWMLEECLDFIRKNAKSAAIYFNTEYESGPRIFLRDEEFVKQKFHIIEEKADDGAYYCDTIDGEYAYSSEFYSFGYVVPAKWERLGDWV